MGGGLLYRKNGSNQGSFFSSSPPVSLTLSMPAPAPDERPSTREGFGRLLETVQQRVAFLFGMAAAPAAAPRAPAPRAPAPPVVVLDDADDDAVATAPSGNDRRYSLKAAQDREYAARVAAAHGLRGLAPDEGVQDRVDAMELESAALEAAAAMDVVDEGPSVAEQVQLRLRPLGGELQGPAAAFLRSARASPNAVLIEKYSIPMTEYKLRCLSPGQWLNDEVINFYMCMLQEKDDILCARDASRKSSHFFNLYFISKLLEGGSYNYKNVKRWTKKFDIFTKDKVFCPVNLNNTHWTLCVVHMSERRIQYYDSMSGSGKTHLEAMMRYLKDEHMDKKQAPLPDADDWVLQTCIRNETPQQYNGFDCGVFSIMFTDFLSDNLPLSFDQEHISCMREKICASILAGRLWYCQDLFTSS